MKFLILHTSILLPLFSSHSSILRMSLEYTTLGKYANQLVLAVVSGINELTSFFGERFNANDLYMEVLATSSTTDKASKLVLHVMRMVKLDSRNYYKFINFLRQDKKYGEVVNALDAEYFGIRKSSTSEHSPGQAGS